MPTNMSQTVQKGYILPRCLHCRNIIFPPVISEMPTNISQKCKTKRVNPSTTYANSNSFSHQTPTKICFTLPPLCKKKGWGGGRGGRIIRQY